MIDVRSSGGSDVGVSSGKKRDEGGRWVGGGGGWSGDVGRSSRGRRRSRGSVVVVEEQKNRRPQRPPIKDNNDNHVHTRNDGPARTRRPSVQVIRHPAGKPNTQCEAAISRGRAGEEWRDST
jgi:hypothetical protein